MWVSHSAPAARKCVCVCVCVCVCRARRRGARARVCVSLGVHVCSARCARGAVGVWLVVWLCALPRDRRVRSCSSLCRARGARARAARSTHKLLSQKHPRLSHPTAPPDPRQPYPTRSLTAQPYPTRSPTAQPHPTPYRGVHVDRSTATVPAPPPPPPPPQGASPI